MRAVLVTALAVLCTTLGTSTAGAAEPGQVRVAHLSPDSPDVTVALTPVPPGGGPLTRAGADVASGLSYGDVGDYRALAPGSYAVSVRAADAPADTPPALSVRIDVAAGTATTVALTGPFAALVLAALPDDLSAPPPGAARVRVLPAVAAAGSVRLSAAGRTLAEAPPLPGAGRYVEAPAGRAEVRLDGRTPLPVDLAAGSVVTLLVLDVGTGVEVRPVIDAAGTVVVPVGGVDAGRGPASVPTGVLLLVALALLRPSRVPLLVVAAVGTVLVAVAAPQPPAVAAAPEVVTAPPEVPGSAGNARPVPAPVRVQAPGIDAAVAAVAVDGSGALAAPDDPAVAGWFAGGTAPGAIGPAVLAAHVDWAGGPGAFAALDGLRPGNEIAVERVDGSAVRFVVTRVVRAAKAAFPTAEVYGPTADAQLRLVTCGGRFDRAAGRYEDNVVVFATTVT